MPLKRAEYVEWFVGKLHLDLAVRLHGGRRWQAAKDHGGHHVDIEVAKIEPVRPGLVEGGVELPNLRNHLDLARVLIPALNAEHEGIHHVAQPPTRWEFVRSVQAEEMAEITTLHFGAAELIKNKVLSHVGLHSSPSGRQSPSVLSCRAFRSPHGFVVALRYRRFFKTWRKDVGKEDKPSVCG